MAAHRVVPGLWRGDPLSYILPYEDAGYQQALQQRASELLHSPHKYSSLDGLFAAFGLCVLFLMLRFLFNGCFQAVMRASRRGGKGEQQIADKLEEELWVTTGGLLLLVIGWQCLLAAADTCSLSDTSGCSRHWPLIPIPAGVHKYYNLELGWYLHLMLKHPLGLGLQDNGTMGAHHAATVALIVLSYMLNVHFLGLLVFCVLNVSNPILHVSKLASTLEMQRTKTAVFGAFALVFCATRVVLFPYVILKAALWDPLTTVRGLLQYFAPFYAACNILLLVLCVMQWVWFAAVLRILKAALRGSSKELQHMQMACDPAGQGSKILSCAGGAGGLQAGCSSSSSTAASGYSSSFSPVGGLKASQ